MVIVREFDRPDRDVVEALGEQTAADVHEALGKRNAMSPDIAPVGGAATGGDGAAGGETATGDEGEPGGEGATLCGPACTAVVHPGDNMMAHVAVEYAQPGDVVVVAAASDRAAIWGELASRNALEQGIAGLVTSGNVRDADWIADSEFPVFASAVSQAGAVKETPGSVNVPVSVGDVSVRPGDVVVGDGDGVTVVPREEAREVVEAAEARAEHEEEVRERIRAGETIYERLGLEEKLRDHGVRVVDRPEDV